VETVVRTSQLHFERTSVEQAKTIAEEEFANRPRAEGSELFFVHPQLSRIRHFPCRVPEFSRRHYMEDSLSLVLHALKERVLRERDPETLRELVVQIDSLLDVIEERVKDLTKGERPS
jgi:hypothetical protein